MKSVPVVAIALLLGLAVPAGPEPVPAPSHAFVNGLWFDGSGFVAGERYSVDGRLTSTRPEAIDSTIDLCGGYVVPPYGEAHNHNVEGTRAGGPAPRRRYAAAAPPSSSSSRRRAWRCSGSSDRARR